MKRMSTVCAVARRASTLVAASAVVLVALPANAQTAPAAPAAAPAPNPAVEEASRRLQRAQAAADARNWETALTEYDASLRLSPSVAAQAGVADAHYQLRHDAEAREAYTRLLAMNVEIPPDQVALKAKWEAMQQSARSRVAEIDARRTATAPVEPAARPAKTAKKPAKKRRHHDEDEEDEDLDGEPVRTANNAVFVELLGNGLIYSINYERFFGDSGFSVRGGFSYMSFGSSDSGSGASGGVKWIAVPLLANYYVGGKNHKLQLGVGATLVDITTEAKAGDTFGSFTGFAPLPTAVIGYRYVPANGGFNFGVGFTPFVIPGGSKSFLPWGGMSFGGVF